jgi:hypothetical protein
MPAAPKARIEALALAIAAGSTVRAWARANKVPERTAYTWAATPEFKARVVELRHQAVGRALGRLTAAATRAVTTLRQLLRDSEPATVRLGAARAILASLIDIQSHAELNERITELERRSGIHERP